MAEEQENKPKYVGYGYHGGGRKKLSESGRKALSLSLQQSQIDYIKQQAEKAGMTNSSFVLAAVQHYVANHLPSLCKPDDVPPNLVEINGVAEVSDQVNAEIFTTLFLEWMESKGWYFGGGIHDVKD